MTLITLVKEALQQLFDVDQIEVYRGPQGSRIGANALAGLIYIQTRDPTDTFKGYQ